MVLICLSTSSSSNGNDRTLANMLTSKECLQAKKKTEFACTQMIYHGKYEYCCLRKSGEAVVLPPSGPVA